jgi:hypothetical protein
MPPPPRQGAPDPSAWQPQDNNGGRAREEAERRRRFAATLSGPLGSPPALLAESGQHSVTGNDAQLMHKKMLDDIVAIEATIAKLPITPAGIGHNKPPEPIEPAPLSRQEIDEIRNLISNLKALPILPAEIPGEAVKAPSRLKKWATKVLAYGGKQADNFVSEGVKAAGKWWPIWVMFQDQLITLANSIEAWIKALGIH